MIILLSIVIEWSVHGLSLSRGCKEAKSDCISPTECCSGYCRGNKCYEPCKAENAACNATPDVCCPGSQCSSWSKMCCVKTGFVVTSPSQCCTQQWTYSTQTEGYCCSGHAQSCETDENCCKGMGKCTLYGTYGKICL